MTQLCIGLQTHGALLEGDLFFQFFVVAAVAVVAAY